jgi:hypothetical protein
MVQKLLFEPELLTAINGAQDARSQIIQTLPWLHFTVNRKREKEEMGRDEAESADGESRAACAANARNACAFL